MTMPQPIDPDAPALRKAVDDLARRFRPAAILLYGSRATGQAREGSDVDLALLFAGEPVPSAFELAAARTDLEALLGRNVDLVVLDQASPILAMQILKKGIVLQQRNPQALPEFTMNALAAYFDLKQTRKPIEEALLAS